MGIWNSTLVYVGARTLLAGAMIALLLRRRVGPWYAGGQVVSDLSCAAFLLGYVNPDVRDDIGVLVIPLLLFVLYWESVRFLENRQAAALREDQETWFDNALRVYGLVWSWGFVIPAVLAGGFLMFNLLAPDQWPFPNPRPPIACAPKQLRPGDELTMKMQVPHGSQLVVFTPKNKAIVLIPYGQRPFQEIDRLVILPDTLPHIFSDSGVYSLIVSFEGELTASLVCRVRYNLRTS